MMCPITYTSCYLKIKILLTRKPGSVLCNHLSRTYVTVCLQLPLRRDGWRCLAACLLCGIAPNRVYTANFVTKAPVSSYLAFSSLQAKPAVIFCCTVPEVTLGGRYPLFLPIGARTFLKRSLSAFSRDCSVSRN